MKDVETMRAAVLEKLAQREAEAEARATDPYWNAGRHTPMRWVARAYFAAIRTVRESPPVANENSRDYFARVGSAVRARRDDGPDDDDEAWFASAIDEACMIISSTSRELTIEPHRADSGPVR